MICDGKVLPEARLRDVMDRVKVLHIITRLIRGGAQENTLLTVALADRDGFEVHLASGPEGEWFPRGSQVADCFHLVPHLANPICPLRDLAAFAELLQMMRRERFAVVHTHTSKAGLLGRLAARLAGVPVIVHTPHGTVFHEVYFNRCQQRLVAWLKRVAARLTNAIITVSNAERDHYLARRIAPARKFRTIYSGIDYSRFEGQVPSRERTRSSLDLRERDLMVLFPARYVPEKGHRFFFAAAEHVMQTMSQVRVFLAGDGPLAEEIAIMRAASAFPHRIHLLGFREDVLDLMRAADVVVSASLSEGLPRAVVEALLLERPVVASDAGGTREVVLDKLTGMLVPCADSRTLAEAVLHLLRHPEEAARMARVGREHVLPLFDARTMVRSIEALYHECLAEKGVADRTSAPVRS
jgi:glycosyltransferase involved in cell wall biosynthesis